MGQHEHAPLPPELIAEALKYVNRAAWLVARQHERQVHQACLVTGFTLEVEIQHGGERCTFRVDALGGESAAAAVRQALDPLRGIVV